MSSSSFLAEKLKRMKGLTPDEINATMKAYLLNERANHLQNLQMADHEPVICLPTLRAL